MASGTGRANWRKSLRAKGIPTLKIWHLVATAGASGGRGISAADRKRALEPIGKIGAAVGDAMGMLLDAPSLWQPSLT